MNSDLSDRTRHPYVLTPNFVQELGTFWTIRGALNKIARMKASAVWRGIEPLRFEIEAAGRIKVRVVVYQNLAVYEGILKPNQHPRPNPSQASM